MKMILSKPSVVQSIFKCSTICLYRSSFGSSKNKRQYTTTPNLCSSIQQQPKPDWNRAVSEAEKIVGYPTSFLSLRWLLSDEIANVALHLRRLVGSNHPLLRTAKNLLYNGKNNMQAWGLIVLLVSKAAGQCESVSDLEQDKAAGVLHSQRALAEVTEMIRTSHLVHKGLVNLQGKVAGDLQANDDMTFGNKIALLSGDYLLGNSCQELANLRDQRVVELMSSALRDLAEAEFVGLRDDQNNPLPSNPIKEKPIPNMMTQTNEEDSDGPHFYSLLEDNTTSECDLLNPMPECLGQDAEEEWTLRHVLAAGSLLGKSCQGAVQLAGHPPEVSHRAYLFGKHLALAWQACVEIEPFLGDECPTITGVGGIGLGTAPPFSLASAPVVFGLQHDPSLYTELEAGTRSVLDVNYENVWKRIKEGPGVEMTRSLQSKHSKAALEVLECFPENDARKALSNIIAAMQNV